MAVAGFALTGWLTQRGCTCVGDREAAGGIGTTVALAGHRVVEGAARVGLVAAFSSRRASPARPAAALLAAGLVTTLAVYALRYYDLPVRR